jgi:hypothetical protein
MKHSAVLLRSVTGDLELKPQHPGNRSQRLEAVRVAASRRYFLEANRKTILSVALVLGLCGLVRAGDEKADPVGTWKCEYAIGD